MDDGCVVAHFGDPLKRNRADIEKKLMCEKMGIILVEVLPPPLPSYSPLPFPLIPLTPHVLCPSSFALFFFSSFHRCRIGGTVVLNS